MYREVIIGLINLIMGLNIFEILPNGYSEPEKLGKALLIVASGLLVLGTLFAHKQHRANILLTWLIASGVYIALNIIYANKDYISRYIYGILLVCMEAVIYKAYTKELENPNDKDSNVNETKGVEEKPPAATAPQESDPPSYEAMVPQVHVC